MRLRIVPRLQHDMSPSLHFAGLTGILFEFAIFRVDSRPTRAVPITRVSGAI